MVKISKRERSAIIAILIVVAGFGVFQFVISPLRQQGQDVADNIQLSRRKLEKMQRTIQQDAAVQKQYQQLADFLGVSGSEGSEFSSMVRTVEELAKETNVHVINVQPQRSVVKDEVRIFPLELSVDGQWSAIARFIYLAQAQPNFFSVEELNFEKFSDPGALLRGRVVLSRTRVAASN